MQDLPFDPTTNNNINNWLNGAYDKKTKETIRTLLKENPQAVEDAFYTTLSFGTGGLRAVMGVGSNRINQYTIQAATQGLANYLKKSVNKENLSVFIGYDSRHFSKEFAKQSAQVLAGNGIKAYFCKELRPTPMISFGCRYFNCQAAIMITASHNPSEYNGYKVYWADGGQVLPPHDQGIIAEYNKIKDPSMVKSSSFDDKLIIHVLEELDKAYLKEIGKLSITPHINQEKGCHLKVIYSPLHGTGITILPKALSLWGFSQVDLVQKQKEVDGDFPTVKKPNPEEQEALQLGIEDLIKKQADIFLATDPDADRVGVVVNHQNKPYILNGNQIAVLCLDHICKMLTKKEKMPENAAFVKTIVTTELMKAIAKHYQKPLFNTLTGFKYIAEKIKEWEEEKSYRFIFGAEESYGYLYGSYTRDKDAIIASLVLCEAALCAKNEGKTLIDHLHQIYRQYGIYSQKLHSVYYENSKEGMEKMQQALIKLRQNPPKEIDGKKVTLIEDYQNLTAMVLPLNEKKPLHFPKSNVLLFRLEDESKLVIRPSGTEPKLKIYSEVMQKNIKEDLSKEEENAQKQAFLLIQSLLDQIA